MAGNFQLPTGGIGPGSQPAEGGELDYMALPRGMRAYAPHIPDVAPGAVPVPALNLLDRIVAASEAQAHGARFDLAGLDAQGRALIAETMGDGEVSIRVHGQPPVAVQESVFAGVWCLAGDGVDVIEVGAVPALAQDRAFAPRRAAVDMPPRVAGVVNAPPLLVELRDRSATWRAGDDAHVVNLTLLPHTEEDLAWLDAALGLGSVDILSRGYGNCRITATATRNVWRVQFFNSMDTLILDTFEVTAMPEVALAAAEDLADSAQRIREVMEAVR